MFYIINPITNQKISIYTNQGKQLLKQYIKLFNGGVHNKTIWDNEAQEWKTTATENNTNKQSFNAHVAEAQFANAIGLKPLTNIFSAENGIAFYKFLKGENMATTGLNMDINSIKSRSWKLTQLKDFKDLLFNSLINRQKSTEKNNNNFRQMEKNISNLEKFFRTKIKSINMKQRQKKNTTVDKCSICRSNKTIYSIDDMDVYGCSECFTLN